MRGFKLVVIAVLAVVAGACGGGGGGSAEPSTPASEAPAASEGASEGAAEAGITTIEEGVLTVGTELPAPPFWIGDDYESIEGGFEVDLARAIADRLGLGEVRFVEMPFSALVTGAACSCDIDFSQVTINDERAQVVDFTTPYFDANQGVLVNQGTAVPDLATAKTLQWGAQVTTTGASYVTDTLQPDSELQVYNTTLDAFNALRAGQIDAVMLDVPIVFGEANREGSTFEVVGQFETGEQYGAVLAKDSPNTAIVSGVISELDADGTLDQLKEQYFAGVTSVPTIS